MKFKSGLYQEFTEKKKENEEQTRLQQKYKVDSSVKVVEKTNMVKFSVKLISSILRWVARIIIFLLAGIGLIALIYPSCRTALLEVSEDIIYQLQQYIPI